MGAFVAFLSARRLVSLSRPQSQNLSLAFDMSQPLQTLYGEAVRGTPDDMLLLLAQIDAATDDALLAWEQPDKRTIR